MRSGRTLKPMIVALDVAASLHVVLGDAADAAVDEGQLDLVALELLRLSVSASSEPCTSALRIRLRVAISPCWICVEDVLELGAAV